MRKTAVFILAAAAATLGAVGSAVSADLPTKAPIYKAPPPPPPVYSWTGWYLGVNGGYGWNRQYSNTVNLTDPDEGLEFSASLEQLNLHGGFGGGQLGYNWQSGAMVFGIEADIQGAGIRGDRDTTHFPGPGPFDFVTVHSHGNLNWFGTVRGRIGYAHDRALFYGTGGFAYGGVKYDLTATDQWGNSVGTSGDQNKTGWVLGAGVEYLIAPHWTLKSEYQYIDFGTTTVSRACGDSGFIICDPDDHVSADVKRQFHTVRVGLNYKF
jgi:outer membrane immunogenic protein